METNREDLVSERDRASTRIVVELLCGCAGTQSKRGACGDFPSPEMAPKMAD